MPPLDLWHLAAGAGIFRRLHRRPDGHAIAAHAAVSSASNLVAEYPYERSVVGRRQRRLRGFSHPHRDRRTWRRRSEAGYAGAGARQAHAGRALRRAGRGSQPTRAQELDRSVLVPNQIRTVLEAYRDTLFTELFPGRTEVPKTLIFAKDDHHAEEIVAHRPRGVRQGQRLRQEDHLQDRRRRSRGS